MTHYYTSLLWLISPYSSLPSFPLLIVPAVCWLYVYHLFRYKYLSTIYNVPGSILGAGDITVIKIGRYCSHAVDILVP